jgi:hypothetical protein
MTTSPATPSSSGSDRGPAIAILHGIADRGGALLRDLRAALHEPALLSPADRPALEQRLGRAGVLVVGGPLEPDLVQRLAGPGRRAELIVLLEGAATDPGLCPLLRQPLARHVISSGNEAGLRDQLVTTVAKLVRGDLFGLDKYLHWGRALRSIRLTATTQRSPFVRQLGFDLRNRLGRRLTELITVVADELVRNAIDCSAPGERDRARRLGERNAVHITYGSDGRSFAISVRDQLGRLPPDRFLAAGAHSATRSITGHSIDFLPRPTGFEMVCQNATLLAANVQPGAQSELIALLDLHATPGQIGRSCASYHYFTPAETDAS